MLYGVYYKKPNGSTKLDWFPTLTEAYHYYLKNYTTIGDYVYYLKVAKKLLNKVKNEDVMECVFRNVFKENCKLIRKTERKYVE